MGTALEPNYYTGNCCRLSDSCVPDSGSCIPSKPQGLPAEGGEVLQNLFCAADSHSTLFRACSACWVLRSRVLCGKNIVTGPF